MANITVQELPANGGALDPVTFSAATAGGDVYDNAEDVILWVKFGAAPSGNVTIEGVAASDSGRDGTVTVTAGANEDHVMGPFSSKNFNEGGQVYLSYPSGVTDISVAVLRFTTA